MYIQCYLVFFIIANISSLSESNSNLKLALAATTDFFQNLANTYKSAEFEPDTQIKIDQQIAQHVQDKEFDRFDGFHHVMNIDTQNLRDVMFFGMVSDDEPQLFIAALNASEVTIFLSKKNSLTPLCSYPMENGMRLMAESLENDALIVVQNGNSHIVVLKLEQQNELFSLKAIQRLDVPEINDFSLWQGPNLLHLAVASKEYTLLFVWLGQNFDYEQTFNFDTDFLVPFFVGQSMYLTVSKRKTVLLKYDETSKQFVPHRSFQASKDITAIQGEGKYSTEYFIALSSTKSTIVYKYVDNDFVPFQEIATADKIFSAVTNKSILLLLIKDGVLTIFEYDGRAFINSNFIKSEVKDVRQVLLEDNEHLLAMKDSDQHWALNTIKWRQKESNAELREKAKNWCLEAKERARHVPSASPKSKKPVRIFRANIDKLRVNKVNDISVTKLKELMDRYQNLVSSFKEQNATLSEKMSSKDLRFSTLRANNVLIKCASNCTAESVVTELKHDLLTKLRKSDNDNEDLELNNVRVDALDKLPCPVPGLKIEEVYVDGLVNGISFSDFQNNVLRLSGDQIVTGGHVFENLSATSIRAPSLDIASNFTRQSIKTDRIEIQNLVVHDGGLLLPLNGGPVTMTGTLIVSKARLKNSFTLHGGVRGLGLRDVAPMTFIQDPMELRGNYTLNDVKITKFLFAKDLTRQEGKSLNEIAAGVIPLNGNVPVHLRISKKQTSWSNVIVSNLPKWVTKNSTETIKVTGTKRAKQKVVLKQSIFDQLPVSKLNNVRCTTAGSSDIQTSSFSVTRLSSKSIKTERINGAKYLYNVMGDSVISLNDVDISSKYIKQVIIRNASISSLDNVMQRFMTFQFSQDAQNNYLHGSMAKARNLKVMFLTVTSGFRVPVMRQISTAVSDGNLKVNKLNGIDFTDFVNKLIRTTDSLHLKNFTFVDDLHCEEINAIRSNINFAEDSGNLYLGSKTIVGDLKISDSLQIPNLGTDLPSNGFANYVIKGTVSFTKEPKIENVNGHNLKEIVSNAWLLTRPAILSGKILMKAGSFSNAVRLWKSVSSPNFGSWKSVDGHLLSKHKSQEIYVHAQFGQVTVPRISGYKIANLKTPMRFLEDLTDQTLKRNSNQIVGGKWQFEQLRIAGNYMMKGKFNGVNPYISEHSNNMFNSNKIKGKKVVDSLIARNLNGLQFDIWARNALRSHDNKNTLITGHKIFDSLTVRNLKVNGLLYGRKIEDCLLKTGNQVITSVKLFEGSLVASKMVANKLINNFDAKNLIVHQMKKQKPNQKISSKVLLQGDLTVLGDATVSQSFKGYDFPQTLMLAKKQLEPITLKTLKLVSAVEGLNSTLQSRPSIWDKLENSQTMNNSASLVARQKTNESPTFLNMGRCFINHLSVVFCENGKQFNIRRITDSTSVLTNQILSANGIPIVVQVTSGSNGRLAVYSFDRIHNEFRIAKDIEMPGVLKSSVTMVSDTLWAVLNLRKYTVVVHYDSWGDIQKYILPPSDSFVLDQVPATGELLLIRCDGVWKIEGLSGPRMSYEIDLNSQIETVSSEKDYYVRVVDKNGQTFKTRFIGGRS